MLVIPIPSQKSQTLTAQLAGQNVRMNVYQKSTGMFIDVLVNDVLIIGGVICRDRTRIVRSTYLGFIGDVYFADIQGTDDPNWTGLGTRWLLVYLEASDL